MKSIYKTIGAAAEYCNYAVDIYNNCTHKCEYCYAKAKAESRGEDFEFKGVRDGILEATEAYLKSNKAVCGETIFLGFSSDAFPVGENTTATVEMAKLLKTYGCRVMVCTKGKLTDTVKEALNYIDSVGITITCGEVMASKYEPNAAKVSERMELLKYAKSLGKETWVSFEPVLEKTFIYDLLSSDFMKYVDTAKFGKLNHMELSELTGNVSDYIDWSLYAKTVVDICKIKGINYIVKEALAKYM
jgi:DNA repair photolyase